MGPFDNSAGAVMFWLFIAAVSVAGTIVPFFKHRETQRTIRAAIDKGQPIDPALLAEPPKKPKERPEDYILFGLILLAAGLGLQVLAVAIGVQARMGTIWPINGAGGVAFFIGVVIFGYGRWQMKSRDKDPAGRG